MRVFAAGVALLVSAGLCAVAAAPLRALQPPAATRALFIGNSLTAANDLPGLVEALANGAGAPMSCRALTFPGYSLEDHWNRGDARRAIAEGGWSTVVLQQGPSALPESRVLLIEYARRFDAEIRRVGARTALYMVWPSSSRRGDFEGVKTSYASAAREVGGLLLPAGEAWRLALRRDAQVVLYGSDGFHPTPLGSYLAALVIYRQLSGKPLGTLQTTLTSPSGAFPPVAVSAARMMTLQEAAAEAVRAVSR